jgi:PPM family protein phosphatase
MVEKKSKPLGFINSIRKKMNLSKSGRNKKRPYTSNIIPGNYQHIGQRSDQQDAFAFSDMEDEEFVNECGLIAVIADGMGGLKLGSEASNFAVMTVLDLYTSYKEKSENIPSKLTSIVDETNRRLYKLSVEMDMEMNIGTTLAAVVVIKNELYYISVGDSRIYHFTGKQITQLTSDHVYARELEKRAASGELSVSEVRNHPDGHALTSYLGITEIKEVDQNITPINLIPGDRIILLTDGVYNSISEDELIKAMELAPQESAESIINTVAVKEILYQDNMTAVILEYNQ